MFKNKFVVNPQHDSEGFTNMEARCRGCTPDEMCPRSGHCERYSSPLRDWVREGHFVYTHIDVELANAHIDGINPQGWDEVDGVKLPPVNVWALLPDELVEAGFQAWLRAATSPRAR